MAPRGTRNTVTTTRASNFFLSGVIDFFSDMTSRRGLPGFLRRTRRSDFNETDDDEQEQEDNHNNGDDKTSKDDRSTRSVNGKDADGAMNCGTSSDTTSDDDPSQQTDSTEQSAAASQQQSPQEAEAEASPLSESSPLATLTSPPQEDPTLLLSTNHRGSLSNLGSSIVLNKQPSGRLFDKRMSYRESQFSKIVLSPVVKLPELRKQGWNGIPSEHRGMTWKLLLGYLPTNQARRATTLDRKRAEYRDAQAQHYDMDDNARTLQEQETLRQVLVDVPRTAPEVPLFRNERVKRALGRLLYIWACRHPASSYVQGINDLATPLFAVFLSEYYNGEDVLDGNVMVVISDEKMEEVEADVYWCLTNILAGIQDHYTADQPGVQRMVMRLEDLVQRIDANLCQHLESVGVQFPQFAFKWMTCLLLREFSLPCVIRLWDTYLSEETAGFEDFHVYVCAAFLCQFSTQLRSLDFDALFGFMQQVPTESWGETEIEMLLSQAYVLSTLFGGSEAHLLNTGRMNASSKF